MVSRRPDQTRARDLLCATHFNALRQLGQSKLAASLPQAIDACLQVADVSTQANWILAFEWWLSGRRRQAIDRWQIIARSKGPEWQRALACLTLAGGSDFEIGKALENLPTGTMNDLLLLARSSQGNMDARQELERRYTVQEVEQQQRWLRQVFEIKDKNTQ